MNDWSLPNLGQKLTFNLPELPFQAIFLFLQVAFKNDECICALIICA
uniref:Uncharacterized protein n=1 Tax=Rhizophora mucronata TaxID=61149 RepID=A0A2P2Q2W8_RHIMU